MASTSSQKFDISKHKTAIAVLKTYFKEQLQQDSTPQALELAIEDAMLERKKRNKESPSGMTEGQLLNSLKELEKALPASKDPFARLSAAKSIAGNLKQPQNGFNVTDSTKVLTLLEACKTFDTSSEEDIKRRKEARIKKALPIYLIKSTADNINPTIKEKTTLGIAHLYDLFQTDENKAKGLYKEAYKNLLDGKKTQSFNWDSVVQEFKTLHDRAKQKGLHLDNECSIPPAHSSTSRSSGASRKAR